MKLAPQYVSFATETEQQICWEALNAGSALASTESLPPIYTRAATVLHGAVLNPVFKAFREWVDTFTWTADMRPTVRSLTLPVMAAMENRPCAGATTDFQGHWMHVQLRATGTFGRCGRGGQAAFIQRQYHDSSDELTPALQSNLVYHMLLPKLIGPRSVNVIQRTGRS